MIEPYLRKADENDIDLLFQWVNDDAVRENAFNTQKITYSEHSEWFAKKLSSSNCVIYIYFDGNGEPIGQGRIDADGDCGTISYSIDSAHRLQGHGGRLLELLEGATISDMPNVKTLVAYVKKANITSQHRFEKLGYEKTEQGDRVAYKKTIGSR